MDFPRAGDAAIRRGNRPGAEFRTVGRWALARDTVFAVVMIVCNGLVGLCIFIGGLRYREQDFQVSGANLYLSVLSCWRPSR